MDLNLTDDAVTLTLAGLLVLLVGLPGILWGVWRVTRPPFGISSFRLVYVTWGCLLAASLVWSLSRNPLYSVDQVGTSNYVRLAFLVLGVMVLLVVGASYRFAFLSELGTGVLGIFFLFSLWGMASTLWSVFPVGTLYKSLEYSTMLALLALTASLINLTVKHSQNRSFALKSVFDFGWLLIFLLIASVYVGIVIWPQYAVLREYRDVTGVLGFSIQGALPGISANSVGELGAILGTVALVRLLLRQGSKVFYVPILALSVLTMVLTQSRSPILAFCVGVAVVLVLNRRFGLLAVSGALLGGVVLTQYGQLLYEFMARGQTGQNIAALTGRVAFWEASLQAVGERPLGGYGAYDGGRYILQTALGESRSSVHSTWLEVLLDTGVVGLVLFSVGVAATWFLLFRLRPYATRDPIGRLLWFESLGVLTVLSVRSVFSVNLVWDWNVLFLGLVLIFICVTRRQVAESKRHASAPSAQPLPTAWRRRSGVRG